MHACMHRYMYVCIISLDSASILLYTVVRHLGRPGSGAKGQVRVGLGFGLPVAATATPWHVQLRELVSAIAESPQSVKGAHAL